MKILIADDDSVSRRLLQSYLEKWGYEVALARDGAEAWRLFEGGLFPMVITDWMMPELDGPGLLRRIRSSQRPGYIYTILLTAKTQKQDLVEGMEAGADDFLTKPFDREELRVRLRAGERIIHLEQNLRETKVALIETEKLASLGRLAAGVAHEINNPLSIVVNNLAVLRRDVRDAMRVLDKYREGDASLARADPELAAEVVRMEEEIDLPYLRKYLPHLFDSSEDGLRRVRAIVQNLRDFARLDEAEFKDVDFNAALRCTLEALRHEFDKKAVRVETCFHDLPPVACHAGKINQAFLNILLNAVQASEREGLVEVRTRPDGEDAILVEVEDHGGGIRPEHLPHLFEPFFTTKPVGTGTGLGLPVSYGVVRDQGGTIEVESAVGRGSLFRIRLPLHPREPDAAGVPVSAP
ncbi:sensor histidine kinase [Singulisphaera acidiphila]|uniref:histidine kinase n=1 Tax=Singulisphaera acidiphila (strain ATCC BAA-1392 / DSM 18658 / VKM B-2454 / MOB10) TaxID=886293 RepID=L0DT81_SINAD|nr:response regulator [Singulisphaera acidiphila]AGA31576.1 histidine kinase,Response regulator receiver domain protein,histidine kinase [Singulisphaera acidiphila DSM 18658]